MERIERLAGILSRSERIVAFTGAGVSTESRIPDFRSSGGIYEAIEKEYGYPPEVLLSHSFFTAHPDTFYDYYKKYLIFPEAQPNDAHRSLAALEKSGKLRAVVTQNIDGLHSRAGSQTVYELHGSVCRSHCMKCGKTYEGLDTVLSSSGVPRCGQCGGMVRPDVVLYEEPLDEGVVESAVQAIESADTLLIMGTSLVVYPAAGLIDYFQGKHLILINKSATSYDSRAGLVINAPAGETMKAVMNLIS
ncbi:MAG TPA: NAD-dependent protein deacylase [Clostridia bacterium]|nr:NAD-dependent protein deacylase [Clostridia bacterium]